ncbi:hypothetical protein LIER_42817 [Lithospermum erythrorhizon]|uniref:DDE Tnp4 domain-containing protein n=1 Tax=Lithospermum erythrorhizon TaxID=34254 RepID=A0AAV3NZ20_LITER
MQRPLFLRIVNAISNYDIYFTQRRNNAGKHGLSPLQKCTAAMRMLAYGVAADACDEYVKIREITAHECLLKFCEVIISIFENEYLKRPTEEYLYSLLYVGQERDGIYLKWPVFIQSLQYPQGENAQLFVKQQESCRKDVERAFGVLQARFAIIRQLARMCELNNLSKIMRACIILHNMIVEDERDTYSRSRGNVDFEPSNGASSSSSFNYQTQVLPQFLVHVQGRSDSDIHTRADIRDRAKYLQLKKDLVEHIWQKFGMA